MKVAYTMNGLVGGLQGKNRERNNEDNIGIICKYLYKHLSKHILENNDVDIFMYTWHEEYKNILDNIFKPVKSIHTKQIKIDVPEHLKVYNYNVIKGTFSNWYGYKKVIDLQREYAQKNNIKYDLVVNARIDLKWNQDISFTKFKTNKIHLAKPTNIIWGWPKEKVEKIDDHIYVMNDKNMYKFSRLYDYLDEYSKPNCCLCKPKKDHPSNHWMAAYHLKRLGWLNKSKIKFSFKDCHGGGNPNNASYNILRYYVQYKNWDIDDLKEKINEE